MKNNQVVFPIDQELPSQFAERLGVLYAASVGQRHKKENGQFFTPREIASFMASLCGHAGNSIRVLDPGCGSLILSCALIEHLVSVNKNLGHIELVAYEMDLELIPFSEQSLSYLEKWVKEKGIQIATKLQTEDFVMHNHERFEEADHLFSTPIELFDIIISNPPYFKIPIDDKRAKVAKAVVNGHPNIYAIFMALSAKLLKENGSLIFITPRSYAAGGYFKAFREYFFQLIDLEKAHLFVSRKETFGKDKVLQETVIIKGVKRRFREPYVTISSSAGLKDLGNPFIKTFPKKDIIDLNTKERILYLPTTDLEENVLEILKNWTGTLTKYNIQISTGPVVAFRAADYIRDSVETEIGAAAPLIWLHNVKQMDLEWPVPKPRKGQFILVADKSAPLLIPNKNYVLLRRFSSKDDKSRLVAAPYFCDDIKSDFIGVENKVNYIYRKNGRLYRNEMVGLCALLNSKLFDTYFRIFNGNVNVSATELRQMALPPMEILKEIGDSLILSNDFSVEHINRTINEYFQPVQAS